MIGLNPLELLILAAIGFSMIGGLAVAVVIIVVMLRKNSPRLNANLSPCPGCGRAISRLAVACPQCGRPTSSPPANG